MAKQTVSVDSALKQANYLLATGNTAVARQIYSQILDHYPDLQAARHGLKSIFNTQAQQVAVPGIQQAVNDIHQTEYFKHASVKGWAYALVVDHPYINGDLQKRAHKPKPISHSFDPDELSPGHTPALYFKLIMEIKDIKERFMYLSQLTQEQSLSILADSFVETPAEDLWQETPQVFASQAMNIVIVGAGIAGLALANMLKTTFRDKVNILLLENRIHRTHYKKPYSRNWLTNIPISLLQGVMDKDLTDVLASLGKGGFIGAPINIFETLMLLSCKKLGVRFLFKSTDDISFLKETDLDMVFDATGNRLDEISLDSIAEPQIQHTCAHVQVSSDLAKGFSKFGITPEPCQDIEQIDLLSANNLLVPTYQEEPIKTAMIKITGLPASLFETILSTIQQCNHDNRFYLWPGTLRDEINQALLIVNLTQAEYEVLQDYLVAPLSIAVFIEHFPDWDVLDKRFIEVLKKLVQAVPNEYQAKIEPPFLYEPFMLAYPQKWERINGVPLIRIGDSIYNGHVKCGNGIAPHLFHLRYIHDALLKGQVYQ